MTHSPEPSALQHESALGDELQILVALVKRLVLESGNPSGFSAEDWVSAWVREPLPALGGKTPIASLKEPGGLDRVRTILLRIQSGAYC